MTSAITFAAVLPALLVAHTVGDNWVQTSHQAAHKGLPGWAGRRACAAHVASYTATTAAVTGLLWIAVGLEITPAGFVLGQLISAVTHYWADRRVHLRRLCERTGRGGFWTLGAPRPGRDDNPTLGTGAYALDQSWHHGWLFITALITALL